MTDKRSIPVSKADIVSEIMLENAERVAQMIVKRSCRTSTTYSTEDMRQAVDITNVVFSSFISDDEILSMIKAREEVEVVE